jgi:hypothetical protein
MKPAKKNSLSSKARKTPVPAAADDEGLGRMMARCASLEKEVKDLKAALAQAEAKQPATPGDSPTVSLDQFERLQSGLGAMSDILGAVVGELDTFIRREYDVFDPRVRPLHEIRTLLVNATGRKSRLPPPVPVLQAGDIIDISEMADVVDSMRPSSMQAGRKSRMSLEISIPKAPRVPE